MLRTRFPALAALLFGVLSFAPWAVADRPADDKALAEWVAQRVRDWQPTPEERRFDTIGWAKDIRTALRLAREHNRPVFLFTYDGEGLVPRQALILG
jgi:hypothetical protein